MDQSTPDDAVLGLSFGFLVFYGVKNGARVALEDGNMIRERTDDICAFLGETAERKMTDKPLNIKSVLILHSKEITLKIVLESYKSNS